MRWLTGLPCGAFHEDRPANVTVYRPTGAACLPSPGLHRMRVLVGLETRKFGGRGSSRPSPRSLTRARSAKSFRYPWP